MNMDDTKLVVKNMDGNDITINVIDIIEETETNKQYICYSIEGLSEDEVFVSSLTETESAYSLNEVTDEEKDLVEALMNQKDGE